MERRIEEITPLQRVAIFLSNGGTLNWGYFEWMFCLNGGTWDTQTLRELTLKVFQEGIKEEKRAEERKRRVEPIRHDDFLPPQNFRTVSPTSVISQSFPLGGKILIAAKNGAGKTFLTVWVALLALQNSLVKKVCFFAFEDRDGLQRPRYTEGLRGYDYTLVGAQEWGQRRERERADADTNAACRAIALEANRSAKQYLTTKKNLMKEQGIIDTAIFNLTVFQKILREKIGEGHTFFVIDALFSIFPNTNNIQPETLEKFLELPSKEGVTFIVIHQCGKNGEIYGPEHIKRLFDVAYMLEPAKVSATEADTVIRVRVDKENRYNPEDKGFFFRRTKVSENVADHTIINEETVLNGKASPRQPIKAAIIQYLDGAEGDTVMFEALYSWLQEAEATHSRTSVTNALRDLHKDGRVAMERGSWDKIRIKR